MTDPERAYAAYRDISDVPSSTPAWNVYGKGVESVGRNGQPEDMPVGTPGPDQLLVRVDAVGLCFSDVKLIKQGGDHPKLYGRDLATEPTRLGHEAAVTVVAVGASPLTIGSKVGILDPTGRVLKAADLPRPK